MESAVTTEVMQVRKRDGSTVQGFQRDKIVKAMRAAWIECRGVVDDLAIEKVTQLVEEALVGALSISATVDVEMIQDLVEVGLMRGGHLDVAKAYILYRNRRAEARSARKSPDQNAISNYIHPSKYARFLPEVGRREVYEETVQRVENMHRKRFPQLASDIQWAFDQVREKRVLPSMRAMQFAGPAIEAVNARMYNCSYTLVDRPRVFGEALYLLLCGCGVGFSVQYEHVEKLPKMAHVSEHEVVHHTILDDIEGWADALHALVQAHIDGKYIEFNYSLIRPAGAPLKTSGGKAPGHLGLKQAIEAIRGILTGAAGRKLRPIECYDIMCHAADAVLSGGIRRSAMIALFSLEDSEMMHAKTGNWHTTHGWRQNSNNSVALVRGEVTEKQFKRIFNMTREWGEPGFVFLEDRDYGTNPCAEIGLYPVLAVTEEVKAQLADRGVIARVGDKLTGFAFCNLCEINAAKFESYEDFMRAAKAATIIGTLQASYTAMPYLGPVTEMIAERDALLGIGMTGMLDAPHIACNPEFQKDVAQKIVDWNFEYAHRIGIRAAARTTCVKPSGTTSLELGGTASGHHAHHARRYIRRVTANELEPVFQYFKTINPHMCVRKPNGDYVIEFPIEAPAGAIVKADLTAIAFLDMVRSTQTHWVLPGTVRGEETPGLNHNVSNTVHVLEDEWPEVAEYLWKHRNSFTAVSLLPAFADKAYAFSPMEAVLTDADEARWNSILANYIPVNYEEMFEGLDGTNLSGEAACVGGACAI